MKSNQSTDPQTPNSQKPTSETGAGIALGFSLGGAAVSLIVGLAFWIYPDSGLETGKNGFGIAIAFTAFLIFAGLLTCLQLFSKTNRNLQHKGQQSENANAAQLEDSSDNDDRNYSLLIAILTTLGGVAILFFLWTAYEANQVGKDAVGFGSGVFGDAFGGATSCFTALAFIGLLLTSHMQRRELRIAKADQRMTKRILDNQEETLRNQILEDRLFKIFDRLDAFPPQQRAENDYAFQEISSSLTMIIVSMDFSNMSPQLIREEIGDLLEGEIVNSLRTSHLNSNIQMLLHELALADHTIESGELHAFSNLLISRVPKHVSFLIHISSIIGMLGFEKTEADGALKTYVPSGMTFSKLTKGEREAIDKVYLALESQQGR